jgi:hypothetical protein
LSYHCCMWNKQGRQGICCTWKKEKILVQLGKKIQRFNDFFLRSRNRKKFQPKEHLKRGYPPTHFMHFKINLFNWWLIGTIVLDYDILWDHCCMWKMCVLRHFMQFKINLFNWWLTWTIVLDYDILWDHCCMWKKCPKVLHALWNLLIQLMVDTNHCVGLWHFVRPLLHVKKMS